MTAPIHAPWTPEQTAALNRFQHESGMHPFTCPRVHREGTMVLTAHADGWHCPDSRCGYWQEWAHGFMADPEAWPTPPAGEPDIDHALAFGEPVALQPGALPNNGEQSGRTTPDNPATCSDVADNPLREQLQAAVEDEIYEYRERTMFWEESGGVTQEIARLAMRGAMEVMQPLLDRSRTDAQELADQLGGLNGEHEETERQRAEWESTAYRHAKLWREAEQQRDQMADDLRYALADHGPRHAHTKPGIWDDTGQPCGHCARLDQARQHLAALSQPQEQP